MAQASSAKFRDRADDAVTIAEKLGVDYLLDGSLRRSGDVARVTADLIDGRTGFSRWSQTFDRSLHDIFAVQTEIARTVATALAAEVAPDHALPAGSAGQLAAQGGTRSAEAYDAYLRGRALYDLSVDEASERAALAQFDAALAADPDYAPAHAARARSLTTIANQYGRAGQLRGNVHGGHRIGPARDRDRPRARRRLLHAGLYAVPGAPRCTRRARAVRTITRTGRGRSHGHGPLRAVLRPRRTQAATPPRPSSGHCCSTSSIPLIHRAAGSIEYAARNYAASIPPARAGARHEPADVPRPCRDRRCAVHAGPVARSPGRVPGRTGQGLRGRRPGRGRAQAR